jgi:pimeloyl-ACP methyl ester carboxylesterase
LRDGDKIFRTYFTTGRGNALRLKLHGTPAALEDRASYFYSTSSAIVAQNSNIARHIPHVSRVDYDHCGHLAFVEAADQFNRDVAAFMQRVHG